MSKKDKDGTVQSPAPPAQAVMPGYMERNMRAFQLFRDFVLGNKDVRDDMQAEFAKAKAKADAAPAKSQESNDWGAINGAIGNVVLVQDRPSTTFVDVFGDDHGGFFTLLAEEFKAAAREAGVKPREWSKPHAREILAKIDGAMTDDTTDPLNFLAARESRREGRYSNLRRWSRPPEEKDKDTEVGRQTAAAVRDAQAKSTGRPDRKAQVERELAQVVAEKDAAARNEQFDEANKLKEREQKLRKELKTLESQPAPAKPDRKAELNALIAKAETAKTAARDAEDYAEAQRLKAELDAYRAELASLENPTPQPGSNGSTKLTFEEAKAMAAQASAGTMLAVLWERYQKNPNAWPPEKFLEGFQTAKELSE